MQTDTDASSERSPIRASCRTPSRLALSTLNHAAPLGLHHADKTGQDLRGFTACASQSFHYHRMRRSFCRVHETGGLAEETSGAGASVDTPSILSETRSRATSFA